MMWVLVINFRSSWLFDWFELCADIQRGSSNNIFPLFEFYLVNLVNLVAVDDAIYETNEPNLRHFY
jgi:hypothetical protein